MDILEKIFGKVKRSDEMSVEDLRAAINNVRFDRQDARDIIRELTAAGKIEYGKRKCRLLTLGYGSGLLGVGLIYFFKLLSV